MKNLFNLFNFNYTVDALTRCIMQNALFKHFGVAASGSFKGVRVAAPTRFWRFVINIVHYSRKIAEDLHGGGPVSQDNRGGLSAGRADAAEHLVLGWKFKNGTSPLLECVPPPGAGEF